ncbi:MAG: TonB-dependent receptor [Saprospiraceae bacterium]|nr:TonB-dependent receptor [Saprospiraceae bacterium]
MKFFTKKIAQSFLLFAVFAVLNNSLLAQNAIQGVIKDEKEAPITLANVYIKGTNIFTESNEKGEFKITPNKELALPFTLVVSIVGFETKEVLISDIANSSLVVTLKESSSLNELVVTSRRRKETAQDVPIPISVIGGALVAEAGAFNVNRLKELVPSVQLYSSNPRNTGLNIRGLGSTFGLTNDGIDPGVGYYVDGVYYVRPASTTLDFIDVEQVEVLRGPQGTLFGKNTTAGAFNVTTTKPSFTPGLNAELSYGNYNYFQAKASITGPLSKKLAARVSFSGTYRDGFLTNVVTKEDVNTLNNTGVKAQLLYKPTENINIILSGDATRQHPNGYAQVFAGVAPTLRASYRQFEQIIKDLNYTLPSRNPFDRLIDHDTPWKSGNDIGGVSLNADIKLGAGTLTSTTAWRYWFWDPSNDRDFTGLQALSKSQATSRHKQLSQEIRWAGTLSSKLTGVFGLFAFSQELNSDPVQIEESGKDQWRFSQSTTSTLWKTPGLFDGYGIKTTQKLKAFSGAVFSQVDWSINKKWSLLPGLRFNYDDKSLTFSRLTYGGLQTTDAALIALKKLVYTDQVFDAQTDNTNFSGQLTLAFKASKKLNAFATYSTGYKPVGLNLGGLPTGTDGKPLLDLATIKPEAVSHYELGIKTTPAANATLNLTFFNTDIKNYQTLVQSPELGVNRGYLSNAEQVRVRGIELDANVKASNLSLYGSLVYNDGKYIKFTNAPLPLEETGKTTTDGKQLAFKDVSGGNLPGVSKVIVSLGGELTKAASIFGKAGQFFLAADSYYRSKFSSSPSPSQYLNVDGYALLNARIGFKSPTGLSVTLWSRNLLNQNYFEQLLPAGGNAGHYAGVLGDPRTYGITLRYAIKKEAK